MQNRSQGHVLLDREGLLVAKAFSRAGERLGLSQAQLADIAGISRSQMSRLTQGGTPVGGKQRELAEYLIRVFRSLDAMTGGKDSLNHEWMNSRNIDLGGDAPVKLVESAAGLVDVMNYLDAARAPI